MGKKTKPAEGIAKGTQQGRVLSEDHKNAIVQTYAVTHNKEKTGRIHGVCSKTVRVVLSERTSAEVQQARARAAVDLAERVQEKAVEAIDAITPAKLGNSSAAQLAVVTGVLVDKLPVLERFRSELTVQHSAEGGMPLPEDAHMLMQVVANKIKSIELLRVELRDPAMEEELANAKELLAKAQDDAIREGAVEADFEVIDLDNPAVE